MPSTTPFSNREEGKIVPLPKQEQILGLYTAATAPATQSFTFDTENEAIDAIRRGKVPLSADVQIRQGVKSASATQNEEMKARIEKESGPVRDPRTGKWLPTQRGDKGEIVKISFAREIIRCSSYLRDNSKTCFLCLIESPMNKRNRAQNIESICFACRPFNFCSMGKRVSECAVDPS